MCNTVCYSTVTMVIRTYLSATLYVHYLFFLLQITIIYFAGLIHQLHIGNATTYTDGMWNYSPVSRAVIQMHPELIICLEEFCESKITFKEFLSRNTALRPGGWLSRILTSMCDAIRSVRIPALTWVLVFSVVIFFFSAHRFRKLIQEFTTPG